MWGGGAAFVEDGEDQQSAARVEGDPESATEPGVIWTRLSSTRSS